MWYVYILECHNNCLYTGITNNLTKRLQLHINGKGSKYTRAFKVKQLLYSEMWNSKRAALKRETEIKAWPREKKINLMNKGNVLTQLT